MGLVSSRAVRIARVVGAGAARSRARPRHVPPGCGDGARSEFESLHGGCYTLSCLLSARVLTDHLPTVHATASLVSGFAVVLPPCAPTRCGDPRTWYLEAAQGQPGRAESTELDAWFWGQTALARLIASAAMYLGAMPTSMVFRE